MGEDGEKDTDTITCQQVAPLRLHARHSPHLTHRAIDKRQFLLVITDQHQYPSTVSSCKMGEFSVDPHVIQPIGTRHGRPDRGSFHG